MPPSPPPAAFPHAPAPPENPDKRLDTGTGVQPDHSACLHEDESKCFCDKKNHSA